MLGTGLPRCASSHRATSISCSRSMPVSYPERLSMYTRSSVATLPVALGAKGQPPIPPTLASNVYTPAETAAYAFATAVLRSEEHTSELQSRENLVCRLLL